MDRRRGGIPITGVKEPDSGGKPDFHAIKDAKIC